MAARNDALVLCDGEWDISRAEEFARLAAEGLARGTPVLILDFHDRRAHRQPGLVGGHVVAREGVVGPAGEIGRAHV